MSSFLPEALIEWILQRLSSWSRLREWRAGELNRICVVVDIGVLKGDYRGLEAVGGLEEVVLRRRLRGRVPVTAEAEEEKKKLVQKSRP